MTTLREKGVCAAVDNVMSASADFSYAHIITVMVLTATPREQLESVMETWHSTSWPTVLGPWKSSRRLADIHPSIRQVRRWIGASPLMHVKRQAST